VATVQLRFDGWVTELDDKAERQQLDHAAGIDNLLYTADADFSCFADLALTSPGDYYREGQGSLLQVVLTPGDPFIKQSSDAIAQHVLQQVHDLFPSSRELNLTWSNVVKLAQSLYREAPGMDPYRPAQKTPIPNFYLAGSYTQQDYIDSMEGATISGRQAAQVILESAA
jgi:zeta-carotene desaturase